MFYYTVGTLFWMSKLDQFAKTPQHILKSNIDDSFLFFLSLQNSNDPLIGNITDNSHFKNKELFLGVLSLLILSSLNSAGAVLNSEMSHHHFSPSFYQPATLHLYSNMVTCNSKEFLYLAANFNHFQTWILLPEYENLCLEHISSSSQKKEFLMYAQRMIKNKNIPEAVRILESCVQFQRPEIFRLLSRLLFETDPNKSFYYAERAIFLGDSGAIKLKTDLLDSGRIRSTDQISSTKLQLVSQLLCKLDSGFAFNARHLDESRRKDFITFITGWLYFL